MATSRSGPGPWKILARSLLFLVGCAVVLMILSPHAPRLNLQWSQAVLALEATVATLAISFLFVRWDGNRLADIGALPKLTSTARLLSGFAIGLILVAVQSGLFALAETVRWVRSDVTGPMLMLSALAEYLLLACREELAFRGYPLRQLDRSFGTWTAQLIVAAIFALEHRVGGYSWQNALFGAFLGSLLFGMAALATRGLALPIGLHAAWNFGQWMIGEKETPGLWRPVVAGGPSAHADHVAMIAYIVTFAVATLAFWRYRGISRAR